MGFILEFDTNQMNDKRIGTKSLVELLSAGAVLVGLVFVGFELRQNTSAVEATTLQSSTDASVDWLLNIASDPELTRIWITAPSELDSLTAIERHQLQLLLRSQWFRFQTAYLQWQRGSMDEEDWGIFRGFICHTGDRTARHGQFGNLRYVTWENHRAVLLPQFVEFVEGCRIADVHQDQN